MDLLTNRPKLPHPSLGLVTKPQGPTPGHVAKCGKPSKGFHPRTCRPNCFPLGRGRGPGSVPGGSVGPGPRGGAQSDPNPKCTPNLRKPQATQHSKQSALGTLLLGSLLAPALHYILVSPRNFRHMPASGQHLRPPRNFWVRPGNIRHRDSVALIQFGTYFD